MKIEIHDDHVLVDGKRYVLDQRIDGGDRVESGDKCPVDWDSVKWENPDAIEDPYCLR